MKVTTRKGYLKATSNGESVVAKQVGGRVHVQLGGMTAMPDASQAIGLLRSQVGVGKADFDAAFGHMLPRTKKGTPLRRNARSKTVKITVSKGHIDAVDRKTDELLVLMDEDRHPETGKPCVLIMHDPDGKPPRWRSATAALKLWTDMEYDEQTFGVAFGKILASERSDRSRKAKRRTSRR
jgi:hypothetical protein